MSMIVNVIHRGFSCYLQDSKNKQNSEMRCAELVLRMCLIFKVYPSVKQPLVIALLGIAF